MRIQWMAYWSSNSYSAIFYADGVARYLSFSFYLQFFLTPMLRHNNSREKMVSLGNRTHVSRDAPGPGTFEGRSTEWAIAPQHVFKHFDGQSWSTFRRKVLSTRLHPAWIVNGTISWKTNLMKTLPLRTSSAFITWQKDSPIISILGGTTFGLGQVLAGVVAKVVDARSGNVLLILRRIFEVGINKCNTELNQS